MNHLTDRVPTSRRAFTFNSTLALAGVLANRSWCGASVMQSICISMLNQNPNTCPLLTLQFQSSGKEVEFLVDSGAACAVIDSASESIIEGRGTPADDNGRTRSFNSGLLQTELGALRLDGIVVTSLKNLSDTIGRDIHGVFSIRELWPCVLRTQTRSCAMLVEPTDTNMEGEKHELFSDEHGMLHAELSINNDLRLLNKRFLIDSGCFFDIAVAREDFSRLERFGALRKVTTIASGNRKGIAERKLGEVEFVKFLGRKLRGVKVIERDEGQVIGMSLLQRLNLSICFSNSEIWLRP